MWRWHHETLLTPCVAGPRMADVAVAALAKFAREEQLEYRVLGREE